MSLALAQARLAGDKGEVPVGAVLVDETGAVVSTGFNQPISAADPTAHAEIVALRRAAGHAANYRLPGTTLVVTLEPCLMCAGALVNARVSRVIFGAREPKWGAFGSRVDVGTMGLNHQIEVVPGIREQECAELIQSFFRSRRS